METSGNRQVKKTGKTGGTRVWACLLVGLLLVVVPGLLFGQTLTVNCIPTNVTCNGGSDGQISVNVSDGPGNYRYAINDGSNTTYYPDATSYTTDVTHDFTGLSAGITYSVSVVNDAPITGSCGSIVLTQPDAFSAISVSGQNWTCSSSKTGTLSVSMTGGVAPYIITVDATDNSNDRNDSGSGPFDFSGLGTDTYTITVEDACNVPQTGSYSVADATPVGISIEGTTQNWSCAPSCNAHIDVSVTGDAAPFTVTLNSGSSVTLSSPPYTHSFTGLCAGNYTIDVADACGNTSTATADPYEITSNAAPYCGVPERYVHYLPSDFAGFPQVLDTIINELPFTTTSGTREIYPYTVSGSVDYNNIQYKLVASREGTGVWNDKDTIKMEVSYNGGAWASVFESVYPAVIPSDWSASLTNSDQIQLRIICHTEADKYFNVSHFYVRGNNTASSVPVATLSCNDDHTVSTSLTISHSDGLQWFCTDAANPEFTVDRTWTVRDECTTTTTYNQTIRVGQVPAFVLLPRDTILDFCHYENVDIPSPTAHDNCDTDPLIEWNLFRDSDGSQSGWTPGAFEDHTFEQPPVAGETYTLWWKVTDDAGLADSTSRTIRFLPEIALTLLTPSSPYNVCEGNSATFNIHAVGGTGSYEIISITPNPVENPSEASPLNFTTTDATINYNTTDHQIAANSSITIEYRDVNYGTPTVVGGCPSPTGTVTFPSGGDFTIHQKITTGTITRDP